MCFSRDEMPTGSTWRNVTAWQEREPSASVVCCANAGAAVANTQKTRPARSDPVRADRRRRRSCAKMRQGYLRSNPRKPLSSLIFLSSARNSAGRNLTHGMEFSGIVLVAPQRRNQPCAPQARAGRRRRKKRGPGRGLAGSAAARGSGMEVGRRARSPPASRHLNAYRTEP